jgi:HPt (histidine-containing phosphotransfer) domain-containing protein
MKNHFTTLLVSLILFTSISVNAQDVIRQAACSDAFIKSQADSIKKELAAQGFIILKEASMQMESEFEMPVVVPLTQGSWYQFVFIGDISSRLYEVRMYDWDEKQVVFQQKKWGDVDGNVISYSYIPKFSEYHMMKPVQVNKKKKNLCGYVMLLKKIKQ